MADQEIPNVLCLDTEPLRRSSWPKLSATLRSLMELAMNLGIDIWLPVAVETELRAQFDGEVDGAVRQVSAALKQLNDRLGLTVSGAPNLPSQDDAKLRHAQIIEAFRNEYNVEMVPLTGRSIEYILSRAVRKQAPFDEKGRGLSDTVIALSLIDHLRKTGAGSAILVTADADYRGVEQLATDEGVTVVVMNLDDALKSLESYLSGKVLEMFEQRHEEARQAVLSAKDMLQEFARHEVEVPWRYGIDEVLDVELGDLRSATTTPLLAFVEPGKEVRFAVDFDARVRVTMTVAEPGPTVRLRVGEKFTEKLDRIALMALLEGGDKPQTRVEQRDLEEVVLIEAIGLRTETGYTITKPLSVRLLDRSDPADIIRRSLGDRAKKDPRK